MFRKIIKGLKDVWCGTLEFDTEPKKDSFNPVTSGGVYDAINGAGGAKEIVYFDVDPSNPPSGIYEAIGEALSNNKIPVIKIDNAVYFYTATGTDKYVFVGGYTKEAVGYTEIEVSDDDSVTSKSVDDKVFNMYMLYRTDPASPGDPPGTGDQPGAGYWICDENRHVITKTELMVAHANCRYFVLNNDIEPDSNTRKYFASVTVISNSNIRILFSMIQTDDGNAAEFIEKLVMADSEGRLYVLRSYEIYLAGTTQAVLVSEPQSFDSTQKAQGRDNIGAASASDVTALQSQVSSLSDVSAYSVKGEATVAQLNAGPSGIQAGWAYQLTDSGTLTDGTLAVVAGDTVAWDGTKWFPLVKSDYYATKTYAQNVAASIAPPFDPTRDSGHAYPAGYSVTYTDGKEYTFKTPHYGPWTGTDVVLSNSFEQSMTVLPYAINGNDPNNVSDLNDIKYNSIMVLYNVTASTSTQHLPDDFGTGGGILVTTQSRFNSSNDFVRQDLIKSGRSWVRSYTKSNDTWSSWTKAPTVVTQKNQIYADWASNVADLNDLVDNSFVIIQKTSATATLHLPSDFSSGLAILQVAKAYYSSSKYQVFQVLKKLDGPECWYRSYNSNGGTWSSWSANSQITVASNQIFSDWSSNPADLDNLVNNSIYKVNVTSGTQTLHFPADFAGSGTLEVERANFSSGYQVFQTLTKMSNGRVWYRTYTYQNSTQTGSWGDWNATAEALTVRSKGIIYDWGQNPSDLNDFTDSGVIRCAVSSGTQTQHFPSDYSGDGILTIVKSSISGGWQAIQRLVRNSDSQAWVRIYTFSNNSQTGSWNAWQRATDGGLVTIGSDKMYTTLRAGFAAAFAIPNCKVVVYPGVYDLTLECADILATTLDSTFTPCKLGNGMHVIFMDGAKVKCNIEKGEMSDAQFHSIKERFEPMAFYYNGTNGDFILENLDIESKNCRYCVHDDQGNSPRPYVHKYINCKMYRTNSNITPLNNFVQCLGGGLGKHGTIVVEGGYYRSEPVVGDAKIMNGDIDYQQRPITYHNGNIEDAQSSITLRDVFFADKGYFQTQDYGPSTLKTKCYISGCRFGLPPMVGLRTETTNFELAAAWNNDVSQDGEWQIDPEDSTKIIFVASNQ